MFIKFSKIEVVHLILAIALITFFLSFEQNNNLKEAITIMRIFLIVAVSLLLAILAEKSIASRYAHEVEFRIWSLKEYTKPSNNLLDKIKTLFYNYSGLIIPILLFLLTDGIWAFLAVSSFTIISPLKIKIGSGSVYLREKEISSIAFIGILAYLFIGIILSLFSKQATQIESGIPFLIALYSLIPLPNLPGSKIFFGRRITYFFTLSLTFGLFVLLPLLAGPFSIAIAIIFSAIIAGLYMYGIESEIDSPFSLENLQADIGWRLFFVLILILLVLFFLIFIETNIIMTLALSIIIATILVILYYYFLSTKK